jgi:hypothetical protein
MGSGVYREIRAGGNFGAAGDCGAGVVGGGERKLSGEGDER